MGDVEKMCLFVLQERWEASNVVDVVEGRNIVELLLLLLGLLSDAVGIQSDRHRGTQKDVPPAVGVGDGLAD